MVVAIDTKEVIFINSFRENLKRWSPRKLGHITDPDLTIDDHPSYQSLGNIYHYDKYQTRIDVWYTLSIQDFFKSNFYDF